MELLAVWTPLLIGSGTLAGKLLAPAAPSAVGLGAAGITAGSIAAAIQASTIATGSVLAIAQSIGAIRATAGIGAKIGFGAAGATPESIAAAVQTATTVAGSLFAILKGVGATEAAASIGANVVGAGVGFGVCGLVVVGGTAAVALLAPLALSAVGLGAEGVTAGSIAAAIQTLFTVAGSLSAIAQSIGAIRAAADIGAKIGLGVSTLVVGGSTIAGALLVPVTLSAVGFGTAGVTAGSIVAAIMTHNTAAGSLFTIAQIVGATGAATAIGAKAGGSALSYFYRSDSSVPPCEF